MNTSSTRVSASRCTACAQRYSANVPQYSRPTAPNSTASNVLPCGHTSQRSEHTPYSLRANTWVDPRACASVCRPYSSTALHRNITQALGGEDRPPLTPDKPMRANLVMPMERKKGIAARSEGVGCRLEQLPILAMRKEGAHR
jgi:hypothetical protein